MALQQNDSPFDQNVTNSTLAGNVYVTSTDTQLLRQTLRTYGSIFIALLFIFCVLRGPHGYPRLFNVRSWSSKVYSDISKQVQYGFVSWMWQVWRVDDDDILEHCGMDSLCFLRVLRLGRKLSILGCFHAVWLLPVYGTAVEAKETAYLEDPLVKLSIANLPSASPRFLATLIAAYTIFGYTMKMILKEFEWYTQYRHKFLSMPRQARNFTIYVTGIPPEYRTSEALKDFFQDHAHEKGSVLEANITMDTPTLDHLLVKRKELQYTLERIRSYKAKMDHQPGAPTSEMAKKKKNIDKLNTYMSMSNQNVAGEDPNTSTKEKNLEEHLEDLDRKIGRKLREIQHARYCPETRSLVQNMGLEDFMEQTSPVMSMEDAIIADPMTSFPKSDNRDTDMSFESLRMPHSSDIISAAQEDYSDSSYSGDTTSTTELEAAYNEEHNDHDHVPESSEFMGSPNYDEAAMMDRIHKSCLENSVGSQTIEDEKEMENYDSNGTQEGAFLSDNDVLEHVDSAIDAWDRGILPEFQSLMKLNRSSASFGHVYDERNSDDIVEEPSAYSSSSNIQKEEERELQSSSTGRSMAIMSSQAIQHCDGPLSPASSTGLITVVLSDVSKSKESEGGRVEMPKSWEEEEDAFPECSEAGLAKQHRRRLASEVATEYLESSDLRKVAKKSDQCTKRKRPTSPFAPTHKIIAKGGQLLSTASELTEQGAQKVSSHITKTVGVASDFGAHNIQRVSNQVAKSLVSAGEFGLTTASAIIPIALMGQQHDGTPRDAGFVTFTNLYAKNVAMQILHHGEADTMRVHEAPEPQEIFWNNVSRPAQAKRGGRLLSLFGTLALCFFWTIPVAFLSSLTEVNSLKKSIPLLADWVERMPNLEPLLGLIAPFLLSLLQDGILPSFLRIFGQWEGHISESALEASLFWKFAVFMVIQTFFVSAISGSITAEITNILNTRGSLIDFLANSMPAQSNYFMQIVIVTLVLNMGVELLRVYPLGMALIGKLYAKMGGTDPGGARTCKSFIRAIDDPYEFEHAQILANTVVLYFMVFFVYTVVAPICNFCLVICFLLLESGYRYQFYHNYPKTPDSGGKLYKKFIHMIYSAMLIAQLTLIGLLLLKRSFYAVYGFGPLLAMTVLFICYVSSTKSYATKYLPSLECKRLDRHRQETSGMDFGFLREQYLQPSIKEATQQINRTSV